MMIDCKRAISLLNQHMNLLPPSEVVSQLIAAKDKCDWRYFLHLYLDSLFVANSDAGRDYHDMQVRTVILSEALGPFSLGTFTLSY